MNYDVIVIGGGPAGYELALKCAGALSKILIIERDKMGGTCLNKGCIPTKALLSLSEKETVFSKIQKEKDKRVKKLRTGLEGLIASKKIDVVYGHASLVGRRSVAACGQKYSAENIVIATGSYPKLLNIETSGRNIITSDEALTLEMKPQSIVIIGGGVIGLEFAAYFNNMGVETTVLEYESCILPMADNEVSAEMKKQLKNSGIYIHTSSIVKKISSKGVVFIENDKKHIVDGETIMMATGRCAEVSGIKLCDGSEIKMDKGFVAVDEHMQTNIKGIYAIGDVTGKSMLAHTAYMQAEVASKNIMKSDKRIMDYSLIPSCLYTHPEVAWVGLNKESAIEKGYDVISSKSDFASNGRAVAMDEHGFVKVVADKRTKKILGVHIIGEYATEIITQATIAMKFGAMVYDFEDIIFPHPTISESFKEAVLKLK